MSRKLALGLSVGLVVLSACTGPSLDSNFAAVRLADAAITATKDGAPYSGRLVARDAEVATLAQRLLSPAPFAPPEGTDTSGLILEVEVRSGVAHGPVRVYADASSPVWDELLYGRLGSLSAEAIKKLAGEVKIGEANFVQGKLEGLAKIYAPSPLPPYESTIFAEVRFVGGQLHGEAKQYFPGESRVSRAMSFADGKPHGPERRFYRNGQLEFELNHVAGKREGQQREFFANGAKRALANYANDQPTGTREEWFPTGQIAHRIDFDQPGLPSTRWFSNGQVRSESGPHGQVEHPPHGEVLEFHRNGALHTRTHYQNGARHGALETFYRDGGKWEIAEYEGDRQVGQHRKWWKNGQLALKASYSAGEREGSFKRWYFDGTHWEEATYAAGKLVGPYKKWWKNGTLAHDYRYVDGRIDGPYRTFYDNGAKWAVGEYRGGKPHGILRRWFPEGRLGFEQHHEKGRAHGPLLRWWADGSKRLEANYERGRLHGAFNNWLEDGSVYEVARYEHGRRLESSRP